MDRGKYNAEPSHRSALKKQSNFSMDQFRASLRRTQVAAQERFSPGIRSFFFSTAVIGLCALGYFLRSPSISLHPRLYAEDGPIFLGQAMQLNAGSLIHLYAGYSHLLQRLMALVAVNLLSPATYPVFFLAVAWMSYLLPLVCSEVLIGWKLFPPLMRTTYIPYVLYPYAAETYLNLPNTYIFFPLGFILIAYGVVANRENALPRKLNHPAIRVVLFLYGFIAAFTGPFLAIYAIPLLIFDGLNQRSLPVRPLWLSLPVLLSVLQIYFSQMQTNYSLSTAQAIQILLHQPGLVLNWFTTHMMSPLVGGYKAAYNFLNLSIPFRLVLIFLILALIVLSIRVIARSIAKPALLYLSVFSTLVVAFSSLLVSLRRGLELDAITNTDHGGRFFYWNTVLFTSILLVSFVISIRNRKTRFSVPSAAGAAWLLITVSMYQNNFHDRILPVTHFNGKTGSVSYESQLIEQCKTSTPLHIDVYPGTAWQFSLDQKRIQLLCKINH
jgi:hypothetical protein